MLGALGIAAADNADEVPHGFIRRSDGLFAIGPGGDGLANDFRGGKSFAASQTRDAPASLGVETKIELRGHDGAP